MRIGIAALALGFCLSQFFRSFLAVLTPAMQRDIGATPEDLSWASALFFASFALSQIAVGWSLDRNGPRMTASLPLGLFAAGGTLIVSLAQSPLQVQIGMTLIGIGVSPVLMSAYFIFLRNFPPAAFVTLAGMFIGIGSLGNVIGSRPLAEAVTSIGWRETLQGIALVTLLVAIAILIYARNPAGHAPRTGTQQGFLSILRQATFLPILLMTLVCYAPSIVLRGLWVGPYLSARFDLTTEDIGWVTMGMALAGILALVTLGPLDRRLGATKRLTLVLAVLTIASAAALALEPPLPVVIALFIASNFFGALYPLVIGHGMRLVPAELTGRGTSLLNLFNIGGVAVLYGLTGLAFRLGYPAVFVSIALFLAVGTIAYIFAPDPNRP